MLKYMAVIDLIKGDIYYPTDEIDLEFKVDAMAEFYSDSYNIEVDKYNHGKVCVIKERVGE